MTTAQFRGGPRDGDIEEFERPRLWLSVSRFLPTKDPAAKPVQQIGHYRKREITLYEWQGWIGEPQS